MKSILFITNSISFGGAAKMLCFVAESLAERGHRIHIVNRQATTDVTNFERQLSAQVELHKLYAGGRLDEARKIAALARKISADIIIGFTAMPNFLAKLAGMLAGIPSIMSERGDPERTGMGKGLKGKIVLLTVNRSKGGVFQTEGAKAFYGRGLQHRGVVIPNPIFVKGEIPRIAYSEREKSVVSVARLDNIQKRYDVMLDAFKLFLDKHPEYVLKLYGKGEDEEKIRNWVTDRNLDDKVLFMGLTKQPMQDICRDGMFLITSDFEGISNALLEAMAAGLPCVSTDHTPGGARLLITDHENGLLAPVGDAEALAKAMCEFAENPTLAEKCGDNAKDVINRFDPAKIIDQWEKYILQLTRKKL